MRVTESATGSRRLRKYRDAVTEPVPPGVRQVTDAVVTASTMPGLEPNMQVYNASAPVPAKKLLPLNTTDEPPADVPDERLRVVTVGQADGRVNGWIVSGQDVELIYARPKSCEERFCQREVKRSSHARR